MSVLKSKRKPSQFEVFHQLMKVRQEVTNLLLQNFGYDLERAEKRISHKFGDRDYEELTHETDCLHTFGDTTHNIIATMVTYC